MDFECRFLVALPILAVRLRGPGDALDLRRILDDVQSRREYRCGMPLLIDRRESLYLSSPLEARSLPVLLRTVVPTSPVALLIGPKPAAFGTRPMMETLVSDETREVAVFRTEEAAIEWLTARIPLSLNDEGGELPQAAQQSRRPSRKP